MRFHYLKNNKPICGKKLDPRDLKYCTEDWSIVDCGDCLSHKDKPLNNIKKLGRGKYA